MTDFGRRPGEMLKSVYDTDEGGVVDDSQKLEASTKAQVQDHTPKTHTHTEAQISDLDHDALKVKGVIVNDAAIGDQKVLAYDLGTERLVYIEQAPSGASINNIQTVSITLAGGVTSNTATITEVVMANTILVMGGFTVPGSSPLEFPKVVLTNSTTITANRIASAYTCIVKLTVVEFTDGTIAGVQRATITLAHPNYTGTATISEVDTTKAVVIDLGATAIDAPGDALESNFVLTDSTTVTMTRSAVATTTVGSFEVLEFS